MDASKTIMKQTFLTVVGAWVFAKPPNMRKSVRWGHPGLRGSMGACVPFEIWTYVTGLFPREGTGCCSCVVLIISDPFYSSLKVYFLYRTSLVDTLPSIIHNLFITKNLIVMKFSLILKFLPDAVIFAKKSLCLQKLDWWSRFLL